MPIKTNDTSYRSQGANIVIAASGQESANRHQIRFGDIQSRSGANLGNYVAKSAKPAKVTPAVPAGRGASTLPAAAGCQAATRRGSVSV